MPSYWMGSARYPETTEAGVTEAEKTGTHLETPTETPTEAETEQETEIDDSWALVEFIM